MYMLSLPRHGSRSTQRRLDCLTPLLLVGAPQDARSRIETAQVRAARHLRAHCLPRDPRAIRESMRIRLISINITCIISSITR
jgi:hypothetical protein|eukprot:COSAG06_NODE_12842_length_1321_cov_2.565466_1_plen_83_part_00